MHNPWNVNSDLALNTNRITQSKAADVDLSFNAKNLSLRDVGSKVPVGSLFVTRPTLGLEGSSLSVETFLTSLCSCHPLILYERVLFLKL